MAEKFGMSFTLDRDRPQRALVMVSEMGHCLNDLISVGVPAASAPNSSQWCPTTRICGPWPRRRTCPFIHVPVTPGTKPEAEQRLIEIVEEYDVDFVVLARYMQVLSDELCRKLHGRAINIHHSFLPGFKGAKPYHQAYDRGVKLVGATAHYVTPDLDEGPIIEQEVIRIDHNFDPRALATVGQDAEALALSRAVRWHSERRVLLYGRSTVVFR